MRSHLRWTIAAASMLGACAGSTGARSPEPGAAPTARAAPSRRTLDTDRSIVPREQDRRTVLVLEAGPHSYVFERAETSSPP